MSEILTGPDRGPPQTNWRDKAVKLQEEVNRLTRALSDSQSANAALRRERDEAWEVASWTHKLMEDITGRHMLSAADLLPLAETAWRAHVDYAVKLGEAYIRLRGRVDDFICTISADDQEYMRKYPPSWYDLNAEYDDRIEFADEVETALAKNPMDSAPARVGTTRVATGCAEHAGVIGGANEGSIPSGSDSLTETVRKAEVRLDGDGNLDEVVSAGAVMENLDYNHWFIEIGDVAVWLHAKGRISANYERRPRDEMAAECLQSGQKCEWCAAPAAKLKRFPDVPDAQWRPICEACDANQVEESQEVIDHEMRHFGGAYGIPRWEYAPLNDYPRESPVAPASSVEPQTDGAGRAGVHQVVRSPWISVDERLPEISDQRVIACNARGTAGKPAYALASWWNKKFVCMLKEVTHWMPLPDAPHYENVAGQKPNQGENA
jgi:hypothetical protein